MSKDEVLIIKQQFPVKPENADKVYKKLIEQMETGVILLPYGYEVVVAPKEIDVKLVSSKKDEELDEYIDKLQRSTAICMNLDWIREYIKMNCPEGSEGRDYILAMLENWRVSMKED